MPISDIAAGPDSAASPGSSVLAAGTARYFSRASISGCMHALCAACALADQAVLISGVLQARTMGQLSLQQRLRQLQQRIWWTRAHRRLMRPSPRRRNKS